MRSLATSFDKGIALAITFYLLVSGTYFLAYPAFSGQPFYYLLILSIYLLSLLSRKLLFRSHDRSFSELSFIFLSAALFGYLIIFFGLDTKNAFGLTEELILRSSFAFFWIVILQLTSHYFPSRSGPLTVLFLVLVFLILSRFQYPINTYFTSHPAIIKFLIGTPVIYLLYKLTGIPGQKK